MQLGKLQKVDLRKFWKSESGDFTPWLSKEANITVLSEAINLDLEVQSQEESVGPFRADILCKDTMNDHYVLIENQLERTDHKHLGQLMTYAAGLDAVIIIWIAEKFTEEHRAAIDWLNRITEESINFFGIEIELYKIGESPLAPKFNVVSKPNDWSKMIKKSADSSGYSETRLKQFEYWKKFAKYLDSTGFKIKYKEPSPRNWMFFSLNNTSFKLYTTVHTIDKVIRVEFIVRWKYAKEYFAKLKKEYEKESKKEISPDIIWDDMPDAKYCWVYLTNDADLENEKDWENQHKWLKEYLEKFYNFFLPKIKELS